VALELCRRNPTARKAALLICEFRNIKQKEASALNLANEIIATINRYFDRYPETTNEQVEDAFFTVEVKLRADA